MQEKLYGQLEVRSNAEKVVARPEPEPGLSQKVLCARFCVKMVLNMLTCPK